MNQISDIAMGLVMVAAITTAVAHKQTARIITSITSGLAVNIKAATGQ